MIWLKRLPARSWMALLMFAAWGAQSHAVGLGQLQLQSMLGQPLRASVRLLGGDADALSGACVKAKIESSDGVFIAVLQTTLAREPQPPGVHLSSQLAMHEPAMAISLTIDCGTQVQRTYQILLDPPLLTPTVREVDRPEPAVPAPRGDQAATATLPAKIAALMKTPQPKPSASSDPRVGSGNAARSERPKRSTLRSATPASRPVLRLSGDDASSMFDLKLTTALSASALETGSPVNEEIRAARARFAALIRNADPLHDAEVQAKSSRERIEILQAEVALLKELGQINQSRLDELQKKPDVSSWIAGLAGLALACLGAMIWLAWRLRTTRGHTKGNWWENSQANDHDGAETGKTGTPTVGAGSGRASPPAAAMTPLAAYQPLQARQIDFIERRLEPRSASRLEPPAPARPAMRDDGYPFHPAAAETGASAPFPDFGRIEMARVEEISDVLQEVEFWMLLNDRERVLEILEPLGDAGKPDSQVPWLYLLDTYREMQEQEKYDALRDRFARFFNVSIARWDDEGTDRKLRSLEDFPHVIRQICERWQHGGIVAFLESLLIDDRDGTRVGFDLPVYRDLMMLISLAKELQKSAAPSAAAA